MLVDDVRGNGHRLLVFHTPSIALQSELRRSRRYVRHILEGLLALKQGLPNPGVFFFCIAPLIRSSKLSGVHVRTRHGRHNLRIRHAIRDESDGAFLFYLAASA